jgi:hypothetical protein
MQQGMFVGFDDSLKMLRGEGTLMLKRLVLNSTFNLSLQQVFVWLNKKRRLCRKRLRLHGGQIFPNIENNNDQRSTTTIL